jgi:hypothetical protein
MGYHNDLVRSFSENWYEMKNEKLKMPHVGTWRCGTTRDYDSAKRTSYLVAHFAASNVLCTTQYNHNTTYHTTI